jgi:hypothetical protein
MRTGVRSWGRVVAAVGGGLFGLFLCLPLGSITCEAPADAECVGSGTTISLGLTLHTFPGWLPFAGLLVGAVLGWLVVSTAQLLAGRALR